MKQSDNGIIQQLLWCLWEVSDKLYHVKTRLQKGLKFFLQPLFFCKFQERRYDIWGSGTGQCPNCIYKPKGTTCIRVVLFRKKGQVENETYKVTDISSKSHVNVSQMSRKCKFGDLL